MSLTTGFGITEDKKSGPPFDLTSADNGLSVDGTSFKIVLGNDLVGAPSTAQLLSSREIYCQGFDIELVNNGGANIRTILTGDTVQVRSPTGEQFSQMVDTSINVRNTAGANNLNSAIGANSVGSSDFNSGNSCGFTTDSITTQDVNGGSGLQSRNRILQFFDAGTNIVAATLVTHSGVGTSGDLALIGGLTTQDPLSGAGQWKLGKVKVGAVALDAANYVEVKIDGVVLKLLKAL